MPEVPNPAAAAPQAPANPAPGAAAVAGAAAAAGAAVNVRMVAVPLAPSTPRKPISGWVSAALFLVIGLACVFAWYLAPGFNWIAAIAMMTLFVLMLGHALTGRALGILINERKLMSLSRFQMVVWTVLVVSAYLVIAIARVQSDEVAEPLVIAIDWQVWALLGISTTSLVGTPFLNENKKKKEPGRNEAERAQLLQKAAAAFGESSNDVNQNREGVLYGNQTVADARFTDLFEGDEIGNTQFVDVAQVQMFFFTVIVAVVYATEVFQLISYRDLLAADVSLPVLPEGMLVLLGISHAGYLGNKAIERTPTAP